MRSKRVSEPDNEVMGHGGKGINKSQYWPLDAPGTHFYRRNGPTDGRTDTPSYRDGTAHLKTKEKVGKIQETIKTNH